MLCWHNSLQTRLPHDARMNKTGKNWPQEVRQLENGKISMIRCVVCNGNEDQKSSK